MKKNLLCFFGILLITTCNFAQNKVNVEIIVISESVPQTSGVYITGNNNLLGIWQPDVVKLNKMSDEKWSKKFIFNKGDQLEFKITRGSWQNEALNDDGSVPFNHNLEVKKDTTIEITINLWADDSDGRKKEGQITGIVKYHQNFSAVDLKPRDIIVWLPPFYFVDTNKHFPVLYMHDGQNIIDPRTSAFQVDWQIDEAADSLIRQELIEPVIIVGIYNTANRRSEYSENDTGYAYMKFIVDSLKPFIDRSYRTISSREFTATGGSSMGGLVSFMLAWEYSDIFSKAICMSPAFKVRRFDFVDNVESYSGEKKKIRLYIDNGGDELDKQIQYGIDAMLKALNEKGYTEGEDYYWFRDENAPHNEISWSKRIWRALIYFFGTEKGKALL